MDYKPVSVLCSHDGCEELRRKGQRYCIKHHAAAMRRLRHCTPEEELARTMIRVAMPQRRTRSKVDPEFAEKVRKLAAQVAAKIQSFNSPMQEVA